MAHLDDQTKSGNPTARSRHGTEQTVKQRINYAAVCPKKTTGDQKVKVPTKSNPLSPSTAS